MRKWSEQAPTEEGRYWVLLVDGAGNRTVAVARVIQATDGLLWTCDALFHQGLHMLRSTGPLDLERRYWGERLQFPRVHLPV